MKKKKCNHCQKMLPISYYSPNKATCKECRNDIEKHQGRIRRARKDPKSYLECHECHHVFYRWRTGLKHKVRKRCSRCNSINIDKFREN